MKKSKQQGHLKTNHASCANKPIEFYDGKLQSVKLQKCVMTASTKVNLLFIFCMWHPNTLQRKNKLTRSTKVVNAR